MHWIKTTALSATGVFLSAATVSWLAGEDRPSQPYPSWSKDCRQIVLVVTEGWDSTTGTLHGLRESDGGWVADFHGIEVTLGSKGLGWGKGLHPPGLEGPEKQEGDRRAPAGVFPLEFGFGAKPLTLSTFPYYLATAKDIWVDDPNSRSYNQWVRVDDTRIKKDWNSAEVLRRNDGLYDYAIAVGHNRMPVVPTMGSAIFIHAWRGEGQPTIGCTAMKKETVRRILEWLDASRRPVLVQVPKTWLGRMGAPSAALKTAGFR